MESDVRHRIGARIREARRERQLTQEQLAERAGLHPTHVAKIEAGMSWPSVPALLRLADALEASAGSLLEEANSGGERAGHLAMGEVAQATQGFGAEEFALLKETVRLLRRYLQRKRLLRESEAPR